jgi:hypothetical protein
MQVRRWVVRVENKRKVTERTRAGVGRDGCDFGGGHPDDIWHLLIVIHRARTLAVSAAYACAQFLSQAPNPEQAAQQAYDIADRTINADWSGLVNVQFRVEVFAPAGPGAPGNCIVHYNAPFLYKGLFGIPDEWSAESFYSRSEVWKADWDR